MISRKPVSKNDKARVVLRSLDPKSDISRFCDIQNRLESMLQAWQRRVERATIKAIYSDLGGEQRGVDLSNVRRRVENIRDPSK